MIINFLVPFLGVAFLLLCIGNRFDPEPRYIEFKTAKKERKIQVANLLIWGVAIAAGAMAGLINAQAAKVSPLVAVALMLPLIILSMITLVIWWYSDGSTIGEMILFILLDILLALIGTAAAYRIFDLTSIAWVQGLIRALPAVAAILSVGFYLLNYVSFKEYLNSEEFGCERGDGDEKDTNSNHSNDCCDSVAEF